MTRHADTLRSMSCVTNDAIGRARAMVQINNEGTSADLDWEFMKVAAEDGSEDIVAWVFDTRDMVNPDPSDPWSGPPPGGAVVAVWWSPYVDCRDCDNYRMVEIFDPSTDARRHRRCLTCSSGGW